MFYFNMHDVTIRVENLSRIYRSRVRGDEDVKALDNVSASFKPGKIHLLTGRSGSGKSTLLSILGMIDRPDEGLVDYGNFQNIPKRNFGDLSIPRRKSCSFLFQDGGLVSRMKAINIVAMPMRYLGMPKKEWLPRARQALEDVGLNVDEYENRRTGTLSGGQRQRLGLAAAIAAPKPFLMCDEPTAPLDEETSHEVCAHLKKQAEAGRTVFLVSHDPVAVSYADTIHRLENGVMTVLDDASEIPSSDLHFATEPK